MIWNESGEPCYLKLAATASNTTYTSNIAIGALLRYPVSGRKKKKKKKQNNGIVTARLSGVTAVLPRTRRTA